MGQWLPVKPNIDAYDPKDILQTSRCESWKQLSTNLSLFKNLAHFGLSNFYFSDIFHGSVALETIKLMGHRKNKGMENDVYKPLVLVKFISTWLRAKLKSVVEII